MALRQSTLTFAPRARLPEIPTQGASVHLAAEKDKGRALPTPPIDVDAVVSKQRRNFSNDQKLEPVKVCCECLHSIAKTFLGSQFFRDTKSVERTLSRYPKVQRRSLFNWAKQEVELHKRTAFGVADGRFTVHSKSMCLLSGAALTNGYPY